MPRQPAGVVSKMTPGAEGTTEVSDSIFAPNKNKHSRRLTTLLTVVPRSKKPHTIAGEPIVPGTIDMVREVLDQLAAD